ncbi:DUF4127 family protein [Paenibacillus sp. strain BS8-2]
MQSKIVYVPLDERPCNYDYPLYLASMTNLHVSAPDRKILGNKKLPANTKALAQWIKQEATSADYALISMDMLLYGGIVPSRLHSIGEVELEKKIQLLRELKEMHPSLKLYVFHLITRAPAYSSSEEEPDYYADYGKELNEFGWLQDKCEREGKLQHTEEERLQEIMHRVPEAIFDDFLGRREVNKKMNEYSVMLAEEGVIDYLVIPLDDNAQYGYTSAEQRNLVRRIQDRNLQDRITVYPGADEIGCTMFSKIFCELHQYHPIIHVRYSSTLGPTIIPKYEDRSLNESIKHHITASGAYMGDGFDSPDLFLMVHSPATSGASTAETMDDIHTRHHSYISEINMREFVYTMERYISTGKVVALGDVALGNGGDDILMKLLAKKDLLKGLDAYAGWNTSGNALGTVISHAIIASYLRSNPGDSSKEEASRMYYYYRLIEDWGYQAVIRQQITDRDLPSLDAAYFRLAHVQQEVQLLINERLQKFIQDYIPEGEELILSNVSVPWMRMFEIGFRLERKRWSETP